jgi:hypothetical protein
MRPLLPCLATAFVCSSHFWSVNNIVIVAKAKIQAHRLSLLQQEGVPGKLIARSQVSAYRARGFHLLWSCHLHTACLRRIQLVLNANCGVVN